MAEQKQDDQLEHTLNNYVRIRDVAQTGQRRWTIGKSGERGSGISVPPARHDDDDDDSKRREEILETKLCSGKSIEGLNACKLLEKIHEINKGNTQTKGPEDMKVVEGGQSLSSSRLYIRNIYTKTKKEKED